VAPIILCHKFYFKDSRLKPCHLVSKELLVKSLLKIFLLLSFAIITGCTDGGSGGVDPITKVPTPYAGPFVTIVVDGGGQVLFNGEICKAGKSPCKYPTVKGKTLQYSVFPTDSIAFYSWENCQTPQGTKCLQTVSDSTVIYAHFGPIITITPNPPVDPGLSLKDPTTQSQLLVRQNLAKSLISMDESAVKWCLSETQILRPLTGSSTCKNSDPSATVDLNGWQKTRPTSITLSPGNGTKTVYVWVANETNEVNLHQSSASIGVDSTYPANPTVILKDILTGSTSTTSEAKVSLVISNDANASAWCVYELSSTLPAPLAPSYNSACWKQSKPTEASLGSLGLRTVYVYTKNFAENISASAGSASINYESVLPVLTVDSPTAFEGYPLTFTISQSYVSPTSTTVHYETIDGQGPEGATFIYKSGIATIPAGETSVKVVVETINDHIKTINKTVYLKLDTANNASVGNESGKATLFDTDSGPVVSISSTSAVEGQPLLFIVSQSSVSGVDTSFEFATSDGSSSSPVNYIKKSGVFKILAGQTTTTIPVQSVDDLLYTPNLTVLASISNSTNASIGAEKAVGIINNNDPIPTLTLTTNPAIEGQPITATVTQSSVTGFDTSYRYQTSDSTGIAGVNYNSSSGLVVIPKGQITSTFKIQTIDAGIYAPDKSVRISISSPSHATIPNSSLTTLIKNSHAMPSISIISSSAVKGQNLKFTVLQTQVTGYATTFNYQTTDGSATSSQNYTPKSGSITIPSGSQSAVILVPTIDDGAYSLPKTMNVSISGPQNSLLGIASANGVIVSSGGPSLSVSDVSTVEGNDLIFTISLSSTISTDARVDYATGDDSAIGGLNYIVKTGSVIIPAGSSSATVIIKSLHDNRYSLARQMKFYLIGSPQAPTTKNIGIGTISNIDPIPSISISDATTNEGSYLVFTVSQSNVSGAATVFNFSLQDGSAIQGVNYGPAGTGGSIAAGQLETTIRVPTTDNGFFGPSVSMNIKLTAATDASISKASATGTILNTYGTPVLSISNASAVEGQPVLFQLSLSSLSVVDTTVKATTRNGSAVSSRNYFSKNELLTIPAGQRSVIFAVDTIDSGIYQQDQQFSVALSEITNASLGTSNSIGTIHNNHGIPYLILSRVNQAIEGQPIRFTVSQSNTTQNVTKVKYKTRNGSALAPKNYTQTIGVLTILPGQLSSTISVPTIADNLYSVDKSMNLDFYEPENVIFDSNSASTAGVILNKDPTPLVSIDDVTVDEGKNLSFTARLSAVSDLTSVFTVTSINASAMADINYQPLISEIFIPAGETSSTFTVATIDDHTYDQTKRVGFNISKLANVGSAGSFSGFIKNINPPPTISISNASGNQGSPIVFTVTQDNISGFDTTLNFQTSDGSATKGVQYVESSGSVIIPAGKTSVSFSVQTFDEGVYASVKNFNVKITNATNASIVTSVATGTITNNRSAPSISISDAQANEGGELIFLVSQSTLSGLETSFHFTTADDSGVAGENYIAKTGDVSIPKGSKTAEIRIQTTQDFLNTPTKQMSVVLSLPVNANIATGSATGTIDNIDGTPNVTISNSISDEGNDVSFTLTSSSISSKPVSVSYETVDDSAIAGEDFVSTTGTAIIPAGSKTATISVKTTHDNFYSLSRSFKLLISNPVNANIIQANASGTIRNIDPMPTLSISNATATDGQPIFFIATISTPSKVDTVVNYETINGTAIAETNYAYAKSSLVIPAGQTTSSFGFLTYSATAYGDQLSMYVVFSSAVNATLLTTQATGTIVNHIPPKGPTITAKDSVTGSTNLTNNRKVTIVIGNSIAQKWCLSSSVLSKPSSGNDACVGGASGQGVSNGWNTSIPNSFTLSDGDGEKTIYVWISDITGKISDESTTKITLDTQIPQTPLVALADPKTGSQNTTNRSVVNLLISGDDLAPAATAWCSVETRYSAIFGFIPDKPLYNDPCWKVEKPTTQALGDLGEREVFIFIKSVAQNISEAGSSIIQYSANPPPTPAFLISDSTTELTNFARQRVINVSISGDQSATKWCLSESQNIRPASSLSLCNGGQGESLGWFNSRPTSLTLSGSDGIKKIYLWVADEVDNVNIVPAAMSITLDTMIPTISNTTLSDPNSGSIGYTNQSIVSYQINNDIKASSWITVEAAGNADTPTAPLFTDSRWSQLRPISQTLSQTGLRKIFLWTMSQSKNVSEVSVSGSLDYQINTPQSVSFSVVDFKTQSLSDFTSTKSIIVSVTPTTNITKWCLSEIQMSAPAFGTSLCLGGQGSALGWSNIAPTQFTLSDGDGTKTLRLWVSDKYNNVNQVSISKQIVLNTTIPSTPLISLFDPNTGSSTETNQMNIGLSITGDTDATGWCVFDQDIAVASPTIAPGYNNSCWVQSRPTTVTLSATSIRNVFVYTRNNSKTPSQPFSMAQIDNSNQPPSTPVLSLSDPTTLSSQVARQNSAAVSISDLRIVRWCLSETQSTKPTTGTSACANGGGSSNGWYPARPSIVPLSSGDGVKKVYLWVANSHNNVNTNSVFSLITVDTTLPAKPVITIKDQSTGSTTITTSSTVNLTIEGDTLAPAATAWCVIEQDATYSAPNPPNFDSSCWKPSRPPTQSLSAFGKRTIYVFTKSSSQNVSLPGITTITYSHPYPGTPIFYLTDRSTGRSSWTLQQTVNIVAYADYDAVKWCFSELQSTRPVSGSDNCVGGQGPALGWYTTKPTSLTVSAGDGDKKFYYWIADQYNNTNLLPYVSVINLDTVPPAAPIVVVRDPNTLSSTNTNRSINLLSVSVDSKAYSFCVFDVASGSTMVAPGPNDGCWYQYANLSLKPQAIELRTEGNRQVMVYTQSISGSVSQPGIAQINYSRNGPTDPTLVIYDPVTLNINYARQSNVKVTITNDEAAVKWCLSEQQTSIPVNDSSVCVGGQGGSNGWSLSRPTSFNLSNPDGQKRIYLWVSNSSGNVNIGVESSDYRKDIGLYTAIPTTPTNFKVFDTVTGSTSQTDKTTVSLSFRPESDNYFVCLIEKSNTESAPNAPEWNDSCWQYYWTLQSTSVKAQGQRQFYLFTKSYPEVVQPIPATATINVLTTAPSNPTDFFLYDTLTGSQTYLRSHTVGIYFTNPANVLKWCLSETQNTKPANGSANCAGGSAAQGSVNGWVVTGTHPVTMPISSGDGQKTVYLWLADNFDNVNLIAATSSILMQTPVIPTTPIVFFTEHGATKNVLSQNPSELNITNDDNAVSWCVLERLVSQGAPNTPVASDPCWVSTRPTSWTFINSHAPLIILVWTKTISGDISPRVDTYVTYNRPPPNSPTLTLKDPATGSLTIARKSYASISIANDSQAVKWCVSETQSTKPENGNSDCAGGAGNYKGWFADRPSLINLTQGNGAKTVYLWIADAWDYTSLNTSSASISVSSATINQPTVTLIDRNTSSSSFTSTGQIAIAVSTGGASSWCSIEQAHNFGNPIQPLPSNSCWTNTSTFNMDLKIPGSRDIYVFAKDSVGNISATAGVGTIQFGTNSSIITSSSVNNGAVSQLKSPIFAVNNSYNYFAYKNSNSAVDCTNDNDPLHKYSSILTNSSDLNDNILDVQDGDVYLCVNPINDPEATPNYSFSRSYHWIKQALWQEKAFLKAPTTSTSGSFGNAVALWNNYAIVADDSGKLPNSYFNGQIYIYSISATNTVSPVINFGGFYYSYTPHGFGTSLATSSTGWLVVPPISGFQYRNFYIFNLAKVIADNGIDGPTVANYHSGYVPGPSSGFPDIAGGYDFGNIVFDPIHPDQFAMGYPGAYRMGDPNGYQSSGGVAVYKFDPSTQQFVMDSFYTSDDKSIGSARIGHSISFYDGVIVAGAPGRVSTIDSGSVLTGGIYTWKKPADSKGKIYTDAKLIQGSSSSTRGHEIGYSVSIYHDQILNRNMILAGDQKDTTYGTDSGAVYIWTEDVFGGFSIPPTKLLSQNSKVTRAGALFGSDIKVNGNHIVISAPGTAAENTSVTVWNYEGGMVEKASLSSGIAQYAGVGFGSAIAVSPQYILIGSPKDTTTNPVSTGVLNSPPNGTDGIELGGVSVINGYQ
jgi:hypothetical protein